MEWLNENSRKFLGASYLLPGETAEQRIREIADHAEKLLKKPGFADKFYGYMEKGYYSLSSPVWANFGRTRGLPVSCFGSYVGDSMASILYTHAETGTMSKLGGGTSAYFGDVRPRGAAIKHNGSSSGSVHFMQLFDKMVDVVSQGSTRRGQFSPYLPIEHQDIEEFLKIGTEGDPIQKLTHGVTVGDAWMQEMVGGDKEKRRLWAKILQRRSEIGYPYIIFRDAANRNTVEVYKDKYPIYASNLCTEIMLPSNERWSFVCVLSSINLVHYEEIKKTDAVETMVAFLDSVISESLIRLEEYRDATDEEGDVKHRTFYFMERAYNFAKENRALGLGVLGWHSLLQSKMIPFASKEAAKLNLEVFRWLKDRSYAASQAMAKEYGEPEVLKGIGRRHTTLNAIAPTTSSSFILGQVSQGVEPIWSNTYVKDIEKMKTTIKNPLLVKLLKEKKQDTEEVWTSIRNHDGSVQHLDFLTEEEKNVFKTYSEISQLDIVYQAAVRQNYIDQGQSLNLMIHPDTPVKDLNQLYVKAWEAGIKSLYYQHSMNAAQKFNLKLICESCEA